MSPDSVDRSDFVHTFAVTASGSSNILLLRNDKSDLNLHLQQRDQQLLAARDLAFLMA